MRRNPQDRRRLDDKIRRLQEEHPILAWLITIAVASLILGAAMLLRWGMEELGGFHTSMSAVLQLLGHEIVWEIEPKEEPDAMDSQKDKMIN